MQHAREPVAVTSPLAMRIEKIRRAIVTAATRAHRSADDVTLVAVSKTHPADKVCEAIAAGQIDFGENRVQEADAKIPEVGRDAARWHLIGHLQSNKARRAVELFDWIHSLDSVDLVRRIDRICRQVDRGELPVLIQVDLGHEATKTGVEEKDLRKIVDAVRACDRLHLMGLMTLPPFFDDAEKARPYFKRLRELRDELQKEGVFGDRIGDLSMGMTHDYTVAIEEGATIVRIGTALFGPRSL